MHVLMDTFIYYIDSCNSLTNAENFYVVMKEMMDPENEMMPQPEKRKGFLEKRIKTLEKRARELENEITLLQEKINVSV